MKNTPQWDQKKPFWDQELSTLDFFREEKIKITHGVKVGGYHMHPWLYYHLNFFKTPVPQPDGRGSTQEILMNPPLDDNILYVIETYQEAEQDNEGMCLFGTRGFTKSTILTSLFTWLSTTKPFGTSSLVGGSDTDLSAISSLMSTSFNNMHPAFRLPRLITDWDSLVEFGWKYKDNQRVTYSQIAVTNVNGGKEKESEKTAGLSPVGYAMDEIGKYDPRGPLQAALPSFKTEYGAKLVHFLCGTGGNKELSEGAKEILTNPTAYKIKLMNWDRLDRSIPEEAITWKEDRKKVFGTFVPGHMSYRLEVPRVEKKLGDFLDMPHPDLNKITIRTTDWSAAAIRIRDNINAYSKEDERNKEKMYYPLTIDDCFLTDSANPFPVEVINRHIDKLKSEGLTGKNVTIYKQGAGFKVEFSDKKRAKVSHGGGTADAPVILFGEVPESVPQRNIFVSGLDGYKQDVSSTDSLGSFYILKRRNLAPNEPCETIACSYTGRPGRMNDFNRTVEELGDCWNAECCMESADMSFKQYLDQKGKAEQVLCPSFSFTSSGKKQKLNSKFGLFPTKENNQYRFDLLVSYCTDSYVVDIDEYGNEVVKLGVEFIDDIDLLEELKNYKPGGNFDRMTAFSHALVYARELDKRNVKPQKEFSEETERVKQKRAKMNPFTEVRHNPF